MFYQSMVANTLNVPWTDGLFTLFGYTFLAFALLWRDARRTSAVAIAKILMGLCILRYGESYVVFKAPLLEGAWPLLWTLGAVFGAFLAHARYANAFDSRD